ncbi:MAG: sulfatase-like hydrolase/transferase [candidate division KSB1 bacterium]|nr:sulfatase-like hydrolase/transferase [candidate division KSB1 bacterium]
METRRHFIKQSAAGLVSVLALSQLNCLMTAGRPKNVLFIICDDLNDSLENLGGHPQAVTPNLDRLMQKSVRFTNAHSNDPICGPSRASFLTGIYPHKSGYFGYKQQQNHWRKNPVLKGAKTFMEHFGANGYDVYGTGKIFHNGHEDWSVWKEDDGFGIEPTFGPVAWDGSFKRGTHDHDLGLALPSVSKDCPDGPQKWRWTSSFGSLADVPAYPPEPEKGIPGYKGWICFGKPFHYDGPDDRDLMPDELNAQWASAILDKKHDNPFMLCVGMNRPHSCWHAPQKYFDMHPLESIQLPPFLENDLEDCAKALRPPAKFWADSGYRKYERIMRCGGVDNWETPGSTGVSGLCQFCR